MAAADASTVESREAGGDVVQFARGALGAAAAIVAGVYLAGGVIVAARLAVTQLAAYDVVGQLPRDFLLSVGASEVVLPTVVLTIPYVLYRAVRGRAVKPSKYRNWRRPGGWWENSKIVALNVGGALLLAAGPAVAILRRPELSCWLILVALAIAALWTFAALHMRERLSRRRDPNKRPDLEVKPAVITATLAQYNSPRRLIGMVLVVAGWVALGVLMTQAALPFPHAAVCTRTGGTLGGRLIGTSDQDVFLAQRHRIRVIPRGRVVEVDVGARAPGC